MYKFYYVYIHNKVSIKFKGMIAKRYRMCVRSLKCCHMDIGMEISVTKICYALLGSSLGNAVI